MIHLPSVTLSGIPTSVSLKETEVFRNVVEGTALSEVEVGLIAKGLNCASNRTSNQRNPERSDSGVERTTTQRKSNDINSTSSPAVPLSVTLGAELSNLIFASLRLRERYFTQSRKAAKGMNVIRGCSTSTSTTQPKSNDIDSITSPAVPLSVTLGDGLNQPSFVPLSLRG